MNTRKNKAIPLILLFIFSNVFPEEFSLSWYKKESALTYDKKGLEKNIKKIQSNFESLKIDRDSLIYLKSIFWDNQKELYMASDKQIGYLSDKNNSGKYSREMTDILNRFENSKKHLESSQSLWSTGKGFGYVSLALIGVGTVMTFVGIGKVFDEDKSSSGVYLKGGLGFLIGAVVLYPFGIGLGGASHSELTRSIFYYNGNVIRRQNERE